MTKAKAKTSKDQNQNRKFTRSRIPKHSQKLKPTSRSYCHRTRKLRPRKMFCKICYDTNEPEHVYTGHYPRNGYGENAIVTCPKLMAIQCHKCGEKGHTTSYCSKFSTQNNKQPSNTHHHQHHHQLQSYPKKPLYTIHKYIPGKYFNKHYDITTRQPTPTNIYDIFNNETTQTPTTSPMASSVIPLHLLKPLPLERCGPKLNTECSSKPSYLQMVTTTYDMQSSKLHGNISSTTNPTQHHVPMRMTMKEVEDKINQFNQTLINTAIPKNKNKKIITIKKIKTPKTNKKKIKKLF